jgi:hypothetical protein
LSKLLDKLFLHEANSVEKIDKEEEKLLGEQGYRGVR